MSQRKIQEGDFDGELDESESEDVNVSVQQQQQQQLEAGAPQPTERILPVETINVEISTPADFNDIYFEIATIKSPYEFQVRIALETIEANSIYRKEPRVKVEKFREKKKHKGTKDALLPLPRAIASRLFITRARVLNVKHIIHHRNREAPLPIEKRKIV